VFAKKKIVAQSLKMARHTPPPDEGNVDKQLVRAMDTSALFFARLQALGNVTANFAL